MNLLYDKIASFKKINIMNNHTNTIKQVIILRKDLNMRKGKMAAQAAHASMAAMFSLENIAWIAQDNGKMLMTTSISYDKYLWFCELSTKIVVGVPDEKSLIEIYQKAINANLPCSIIRDAGLTEFSGIPTLTAVGIGPCESSLIDVITGDLILL